MARPMTFAMAEALSQGAPPFVFCELEHPDNTGYFWSGFSAIDWDNHSWAPTSTLGAITPIEHSSIIAIQEIKFTLSGADPEVIAKLSSDVRNKAGRAWLGCLDDRGLVIPDPMPILDSQLDYQVFKIEDNGSATVQIVGRSGFFTLDRAVEDVWSDADHRSKYPTDSGLSMLASLQNQQLVWGPLV